LAELAGLGGLKAKPVREDRIPSRHNALVYRPVDIGQSEVPAAVAEGELLVVHAHEVQEGGVQVVDVHLILDGIEAELVGGAVGESALDAAAGEPDGEAGAVVIASLAL